MLWQTLRSMAIEHSTRFVQSFRRLKAQNQHPILSSGLDAEKIEASLTDLLTVTLPNKPGPHKPEKNKVNAVA